MSTTTEVDYAHRMEYRTRDKDGTWSEPVYQYHNPTPILETAEWRHQYCKPVEYVWESKFEGIYGYSYGECTLVKRTTVTEYTEEELT